ncbi:MAG: hypothetical protein QM581_06215 [Pseudomonas sp.]
MSSARAELAGSGFRVERIFHPTARVPDLAEAEAFFASVFGRHSTSLTTIIPSRPEYPTEYSTFTVIRDVLFDSIDPKLHTVAGVQRYPTVRSPLLSGFGWYVDGMEALYAALRRNGIRAMNLRNEIVEGDEPPQSPGGGVVTFFLVAEDAGLQYQFMREGTPFPLDPRLQPGWTLPPPEADDPLGIECSSHHTFLTDRPERVLRLVVDVLGGRVVHEGRNELIGADSTFVALTDALLEYAVPDAGTPARAKLDAGNGLDAYHAISWKVADLTRVERHLAAQGVGIGARSDTAILTDPKTSLDIAWGFSTSFQPNDPRQAR